MIDVGLNAAAQAVHVHLQSVFAHVVSTGRSSRTPWTVTGAEVQAVSAERIRYLQKQQVLAQHPGLNEAGDDALLSLSSPRRGRNPGESD